MTTDDSGIFALEEPTTEPMSGFVPIPIIVPVGPMFVVLSNLFRERVMLALGVGLGALAGSAATALWILCS